MICNGKFTFGAEVDLNSNPNVISKSILLVVRFVGPSIARPHTFVPQTSCLKLLVTNMESVLEILVICLNWGI